MPAFSAVPRFSSSTKRTGSAGPIEASEKGSPGRMSRTLPSWPMNSRSSGIGVFFIQKPTGLRLLEDEQHAVIVVHGLAKHQPGGTLARIVGDFDGEGLFARRGRRRSSGVGSTGSSIAWLLADVDCGRLR